MSGPIRDAGLPSPSPCRVPSSAPPHVDRSRGEPTADRDLILAIMHDPGACYFNVHNAPFPGGALRAQLSKG